jgi:hypothetical protein
LEIELPDLSTFKEEFYWYQEINHFF